MNTRRRWAIVGGGMLGTDARASLRAARRRRHGVRGSAVPRRAGERLEPRRRGLGPPLPRDPCSPTRTCERCSRELGLEHEMEWVETRTGFYTRRQALLDVEHARVPALPAAAPDRQVPPRRHDLLRLEDPGLAAAGAECRSSSGCRAGRAGARSRTSGCRSCGRSSARAIGRRRPRSSGPPSRACTPPAAPA